jgi:hypothetical protein
MYGEETLDNLLPGRDGDGVMNGGDEDTFGFFFN